MIVKKAQVAAWAHVSRSAISQAVKRGDLLDDPGGGGIDAALAPNLQWLAEHCDGVLPVELADIGPISSADEYLELKALPKLAEETDSMTVFARFPDGRELPIVRHSFKADGYQLDDVIFPIPEAVRIDYLPPAGEVAVFRLTGDALPAWLELDAGVLELFRRYHSGVDAEEVEE